MNPKIAIVCLVVIGLLFVTGIGLGVSNQDLKGFSLKDPPGWLKAMSSLLTSDASTRIDPSEIREEVVGGKPEPFQSPIELGKISGKSHPLRRSFTIAESRRSVRKLKLSTQDPHEIKVLFHPASKQDSSGPQDPDQAFTLKPNASQTITVLSQGGSLTLEVKANESARVRVE
jgi:hypothetical protein